MAARQGSGALGTGRLVYIGGCCGAETDGASAVGRWVSRPSDGADQTPGARRPLAATPPARLTLTPPVGRKGRSRRKKKKKRAGGPYRYRTPVGPAWKRRCWTGGARGVDPSLWRSILPFVFLSVLLCPCIHRELLGTPFFQIIYMSTSLGVQKLEEIRGAKILFLFKII